MQPHLGEAERGEHDLAAGGAGEVLARARDAGDAGPLVHQQRLVAVAEPRQVRDPAQVRRDRAGVVKKDNIFYLIKTKILVDRYLISRTAYRTSV